MLTDAGEALDRAEMARFEKSTGQLAATDRGRTASLYYINYETASLVRETMHPQMLVPDLLQLISQAKEFTQMKVRFVSFVIRIFSDLEKSTCTPNNHEKRFSQWEESGD